MYPACAVFLNRSWELFCDYSRAERNAYAGLPDFLNIQTQFSLLHRIVRSRLRLRIRILLTWQFYGAFNLFVVALPLLERD